MSNRLFTAIDFPADVMESISSICRGIPGVRWTPPEQLHLTLRFIGDVERELFNDIREVLTSVDVPDFSLTLQGVGQFLSGKTPRVLWIGVEESGPLVELHKQMEKALARVDILPEKRKFRPHVTLARLKSAALHHVQLYLEQYSSFQTVEFPVREFTLYSSKLKPEGALHTVEGHYPPGES